MKPVKQDKGMILLALLGVLLVSVTVVAIGQLSLNAQDRKRHLKTIKALNSTRDAIMGYAAKGASVAQPPGTLPCPAADAQGNQSLNAATGSCTLLRGLVPYRTLDIPQPFDGNGAPLWYGIAANYGGNYSSGAPRNSSLASTLTVTRNILNRTDTAAFVLLAPNMPLGGQQPVMTPTLSAAGQYLEGRNATATPGAYDDLLDDTHNDELLVMPLASFWSGIEKRVLAELKNTLGSYRTQCGLYPWAVPYTNAGNSSVNGTYEGRIPLTNLTPTWGAACGTGTAPAAPAAWFTSHWANSIYYSICKDTSPANPPLSACLQLSSGAHAEAVVIAPGIPLSTVTPSQNRAVLAITNYFEDQNAIPADKNLTDTPPAKHTPVFNDVLLILR